MAVLFLDVRLRAVNPTYTILPDNFLSRLRIIVRIALLEIWS